MHSAQHHGTFRHSKPITKLHCIKQRRNLMLISKVVVFMIWRWAQVDKRHNDAINSDVQKRHFALLLHAGYGERYAFRSSP